jgi:hypothetical protein
MNGFLARQLRELMTAIEATGGRLLGSVIWALLVALALFTGLAFLAVALFLKVGALYGTINAAAAVGGAFVIVALIAFVILKVRQPKVVPAPQPTPIEIEKAQTRAALAANIDETIAPLLGAFREANMQPEEFALRLASEVTKQTGAFGLIALAVAGGFVVARQIAGSKKS